MFFVTGTIMVIQSRQTIGFSQRTDLLLAYVAIRKDMRALYVQSL